MKYKCLSIAGFDGSGGAGMQADMKVFSALGCYGMTILTALPVQNTCGVQLRHEIPLSVIEKQLHVIFEDIIPDAIKIGMLLSNEIIELVGDFLRKKAVNIPIILDPVMVCKSGDKILRDDAIGSLRDIMLPISDIITPNIPEAQVLCKLNDVTDLEVLGDKLLELNTKAILIKDGHGISPYSNDLFLEKNGNKALLKARRIDSKNTHGTGCTLSAAIAAFIAKGMNMLDACKCAKSYLFGAMISSREHSLGFGNGPVNHLYHLEKNLNSWQDDVLNMINKTSKNGNFICEY